MASPGLNSTPPTLRRAGENAAIDMGRRITAKATRDERAKQRRTLGRLRDQRVKPSVHTSYLKAVGRFLLWAAACEVPYAASLPELDQQLALYLEALLQQGDAKSLAGDTLSGAQHLLLQKVLT